MEGRSNLFASTGLSSCLLLPSDGLWKAQLLIAGDVISNNVCLMQNPGNYTSIFSEVKNETSSTTSDPYYQGGVYYFKFWVPKERRQNIFHQNSCCPALMLEIVGPAMRINGMAFGQQVMCQPLTPMIPLLPMVPADMSLMQLAAKALVALRCTLPHLQAAYHQIEQLAIPEAADALQQHLEQQEHHLWAGHPVTSIQLSPTPRDLIIKQLPYRLQLPGLSTQTLMPGKLLYLVRPQHAAGELRLFKYAISYGANVHRAWAAAGLAPAIYSCLQLPGGWLEIQMEFLSEDQHWLRLDKAGHLRQPALDALRYAHQLPVGPDQRGVHGDARDNNVFVRELPSGNPEVKFIDFDWAGVAGEARYPAFMNHEEVNWHPEASDGCLMQACHDMHLLNQPGQRRVVPYTWY